MGDNVHVYARKLVHEGIIETAFISYDYTDGNDKMLKALSAIINVVDSLNIALYDKEKRRSVYDLITEPKVQQLLLIMAQNNIRFKRLED